MDKWRKVSGPREYTKDAGLDMDVGWAWTFERGGRESSVKVAVAGGRLGSSELPEESQRAIRTKGLSAIEPFLGDDELPPLIIVSTGGVGPRTTS